MPFRHHDDDDGDGAPDWARQVIRSLQQIIHNQDDLKGLLMTVNTDAQHLSDDVAALGTAIQTAVTELKAQIAGGTPPAALDFGPLDALVASTQAEAATDAPPAPAPPAPAT